MSKYFYTFLILILSSCYSTKTTFYPYEQSKFNALDSTQEVFIYTSFDSLIKGRIKVGDFDHFQADNINLPNIIERLKKEARLNGANIIKIKNYYTGDARDATIKAPILSGSYYRYIDSNLINKFNDSTFNVNFESNTIAWLYIYRNETNGGIGAGQPLSLFLNDSSIGVIQNRKFYKIKIPHQGIYKISSATNSKNYLQIEITPGNNYYVSVLNNVSMGYQSNSITMSSGPTIFNIIDELHGKLRISSLNSLRKNNGN